MMPQVVEVVHDRFLFIRPVLFLEVAKLMRNLDGPGEVFHIRDEHERLQRADYGLNQVPRAVAVTLLFGNGTDRVFDLLDEVLDAAVVPMYRINALYITKRLVAIITMRCCCTSRKPSFDPRADQLCGTLNHGDGLTTRTIAVSSSEPGFASRR